ncbi:MAG TPA: glycosyltransferase family 2 protein [Xanthobacteraceae bacterium]|nr:glycosyltransferase family 2 protein [Xanthobacteraceae bacterium]
MANSPQLDLPAEDAAASPLELTILMPCLNEAETISTCVTKAKSFLARAGIAGEVLIADNGSSDGSVALAQRDGARVIAVAERGYGAALRAGVAAARGRFVVMGDADDSYDFSGLDPFIAKLRGGCDLVMGNRFAGGIAPGAMPFLHRYLGNPVLSFIGRTFFRAKIGDFHCGLRGFRRDAILGLGLRTSGMELASEMVVRAAIVNLTIAEVPTTLAVDGRSRPPHLRTWHDGWRHLRFLLMFSPRWLFLYPGLALIALGVFGVAMLFPGPLMISPDFGFDDHTFLVSAIAVLVGVQVVAFGIIARHFAAAHELLPRSRSLATLLSVISLERGLLIAAGIVCTGMAGVVWSLWQWALVDFGPLTAPVVMRVLTFALVLIAIGVQQAFTFFLLGVIDMPFREKIKVPG